MAMIRAHLRLFLAFAASALLLVHSPASASLSSIAGAAATQDDTASLAPRGYFTTEEFGVSHVILSGAIPGLNGGPTEQIMLHAFISGRFEADETILRGFFFVEGVTHARISGWGALKQPVDLMKQWRYPVTFKDHTTGAAQDAVIDTRPWDAGQDSVLPIPFQAAFKGQVPCIDVIVHQWIHTALICLKEQPSDLDRLLQMAEKEKVASEGGGPAVWFLIAPFRNAGLTPGYVAMLAHSVKYHVHVGFSGTLLYASPYLVRELNADPEASRLIREGKLVLILWDHFNVYNKQGYSDALDHRFVYNHAIFAFKPFKKTALMVSDADEFFVLQPPVRTVQQLVRKRSCMEFDRKPHSGSKSWVTIAMKRYNFRSTVSELGRSKGVTGEKPPLEPEVFMWKVLVGPEGTYGGRLAFFNIHNAKTGDDLSVKDDASGKNSANEQCAFLMHVANMWTGRFPLNEFQERKGLKWSWLLPDVSDNAQAYERRCLQHGDISGNTSGEHS